jgi:hypothetical protein
MLMKPLQSLTRIEFECRTRDVVTSALTSSKNLNAW